MAKVNVPVYRTPNDSAPSVAVVKKGQPVGVVYSYLGISPSYNRSVLYWAFIDGAGLWYYSKQLGGYYDVSALKQQGVLTVEQQLEEEKDKDLPWYESLIKKYGGYVLVTVLGAAVIKGVLSRPKSPSNNG